MALDVEPKILEWAKKNPFAKKFLNRPVLLIDLYKNNAVAYTIDEMVLGMKCDLKITSTNKIDNKASPYCTGCNSYIDNCTCATGSPGSIMKQGRRYTVYDMSYTGDYSEESTCTVNVAPWDDGKLPIMEFGKIYRVEGRYDERPGKNGTTYIGVQADNITEISVDTIPDQTTDDYDGDTEPPHDNPPEPEPTPEPSRPTEPDPEHKITHDVPEPKTKVKLKLHGAADPENEPQKQKLTKTDIVIRRVTKILKSAGYLKDDTYQGMVQGLSTEEKQQVINTLYLFNEQGRWYSDTIDG